MNKSTETVAVAMSGGVDSSVAAALLKDAGYNVFGVMLKLWSEGDATKNRCCTPDAVNDAREVADRLDIPFYTLDYRDRFKNKIVDYYIDAHAQGITPNPCIYCNQQVRFGDFLQDVIELGADYFATGHYASIIRDEDGNPILKRGLDSGKDQSYMLHRLNKEQLNRALLPLGVYMKSEIRSIAEEKGLVIHSKKDSQDLCFLGDIGQRGFLKKHIPENIKEGLFVDRQGKTLGRHEGLSLYTIGQRRGLDISHSEPLFVLSKDVENNNIVLGTAEETASSGLTGRLSHFTLGEPSKPVDVDVQIRYKGKPFRATLYPLQRGQIVLKFSEPRRDVCPGQSAVFYQGDLLLGGAIIGKSLFQPEDVEYALTENAGVPC